MKGRRSRDTPPTPTTKTKALLFRFLKGSTLSAKTTASFTHSLVQRTIHFSQCVVFKGFRSKAFSIGHFPISRKIDVSVCWLLPIVMTRTGPTKRNENARHDFFSKGADVSQSPPPQGFRSIAVTSPAWGLSISKVPKRERSGSQARERAALEPARERPGIGEEQPNLPTSNYRFALTLGANHTRDLVFSTADAKSSTISKPSGT